MATLQYVGPAVSSANDIADQAYITSLLAQNMTMPAAVTQIDGMLTGFALQTYANTAMANLATPAYVTAQVANYTQFNVLGQDNGPVQVLAATGQVAPGVINEASTQQWPSPFWSPTQYNTASVTATTTPAQLYPIAIPDPGYDYVIFSSGLVDVQVNATTQPSSGVAPQIFVRQGSPTGPIVAYGYGVAESYLGPAPGQLTGSLSITEGGSLTGGWALITGWTALNNNTYTTSMFGNYLQISQSNPNITLSASFTFSGAAVSFGTLSVSTQLRIVNNTGAVIATGTAVAGASGTCTVTYTGAVTVGQLYGFQAIQTFTLTFVQQLHGETLTYATITSGSVNLTPSSVTNNSTVNILPVPFEQQYPQTGETTLYVMLSPSDNQTQVTATKFDPGLWVMPIPWAPPPAAPTTYDSTGAGALVTSGTSWSWSHTLGSTAQACLAFFTYYGAQVPIVTATCGGVPMRLLVSAPAWLQTSSGLFGLTQDYMSLFVFGILGPPTGARTITITSSATGAGIANSVSYDSVAAFTDAEVNDEASTAAALELVAAAGQMAVMAFASEGADTAFTAFNQTSRYSNAGSGNAWPLLIGDSHGGGIGALVGFGATAAGNGWAGSGLTLSPVGVPSVTFDAMGSGYQSSTSTTGVSAMWAHQATAGASVVVFTAAQTNATESTFAPTCTYGGVTMSFLGVVNLNNQPDGWVEAFGLLDVPGGQQNVVWTVSSTTHTFTAAAAQSMSYLNVGSFGTTTLTYGTGNAITSGTGVTIPLNGMAAQAFASGYTSSPGVSYTAGAYNENQRYIAAPYNSSATSGLAFVAGDALGGVLTFLEQSSVATQYASVIVPLAFG